MIRVYVADYVKSTEGGMIYYHWPAVFNGAHTLETVETRLDATLDGWRLYVCDVDDVKHAQIISDPLVTYLPITASGSPAPLAARLSELDSLSATETILTSLAIPVSDLHSANATVRDYVTRIIKRLRLREMLGTLDFDDITGNVGDKANSQARKTKLEGMGFNVGLLNNPNLTEQAIISIVNQINVPVKI